MSNKRELTRAELVRLRRKQEYAQHMERASKVTVRLKPKVTKRVKPKTVKPVRKPKQNARRRFNIALHMPRSDTRAIS
ncbi:MAG TPA: hypothetical protein VLA72_14185, partial [Anaerolineales bacterium]|nr:hypothetical protein [Anaerolineales bacterium]